MTKEQDALAYLYKISRQVPGDIEGDRAAFHERCRAAFLLLQKVLDQLEDSEDAGET
jgi:hypothetical protein